MKTLTATVQPFAHQDCPALVTLYNAVEPEYRTTEVEVRHWDAHREPKIDWRRLGLATALKLQNLHWAAENGHRQVRTWNSTENTGMLAINMALGFEKQPAWINLKKDVETEDGRNKRP